MSFECNNIKLAIRNDKSEIIYGTFKQCLVTANHDACLLSLVNALNSRANNMCANASPSANQKRHRTQVWKPKQVGFKGRLTCKLRLPRFSRTNTKMVSKFNCVSWQVVQICLWCVDSGCSKHITGNIKLFINFVWKFLGTVRFGNDHIASILGYGDLKWGNITITRVYFVEGLGHNLFSVGQFCDVDLEVASGGTLTSLETWMKTKHFLPSCFWALCYPKNDREDIGKLGAKGDIDFFIGYSANSVASRVYNQRTKKIMETINITFDELSAMAFEQNSSRPGLQKAPRTIPATPVIQNLQAPIASMSFQDFAPAPTNSSNTLVSSHNVDEQSQRHAQQQRNLTPSPITSAADNVLSAMFEGDLFVNPFATPST
nr:integrase, catalytic region, zinc finger, CCHC-type, peptidase aspartic, catalytic [Tanacetum cinerariifolium]